MNESAVAINRTTWLRFARAIRDLTSGEVGGRAIALLGLLIAFLLAINALNVVNSYVGRDFMTALEQRDQSGFARYALFYLAVFAASTLVAVVHRFTEERLGLLWREWLTRRLVASYLAGRTYYRMDVAGDLANPDQRIADDVRSFAVSTLSFLLMLTNGAFTAVAFSGVLWDISPRLFAVAVSYAALGSLLTIALGRPLVWLNYSQLDREAELRSDLLHVGDNAESVALLHREARLGSRLGQRIDALVANTKRMIAVNRNLGFFTTGYNYLIQIIPALLVAPLYFRGEAEFGVIPQSAMAFSTLLGAFSLIITQIQSLSSYAAVLGRLSDLTEAIEHAEAPWAIELCDEAEGQRVAWERLTLRAPKDDRVLVRELSASVPRGTRVLIAGPEEARVALLRASAGIASGGEGRIVRPGLDQVSFLPERPYLPPGTLRELLVRTGREHEVSDGRIVAALRDLGAESLLERAGGLDSAADWNDLLSLGEQQLLLFARLLLAAPRFAFVDRPTSALDPERVARILPLLAQRGITYLVLGTPEEPREPYDALLALEEDGAWSWQPLAAAPEARA